MKKTLLAAAAALFAFAPAANAADDDPIKIALLYGKTGPLEAYAKQTHNGLMLGLEYATNGTMKVLGRDIEVLEKDTQLKPDLGRALLAEAYGDDEVDIAIGGTSSGVTLAMLPVAEEYGKILLVEPAVADSITGEKWNRYIFRTGRNSSQDAVANAVALGGENVKIATLAQDYAFGRDGVAAFKEALKNTGGEVVFEEYVPQDTTDFTASAQRIFDALKDEEGRKFIFIIWAGAGQPAGQAERAEARALRHRAGHGGNILPALAAYKAAPGMEGATYYYYDIPKNPVNDWLVAEHMKRFGTPPDFFTAGGMSAAMAVVTALEKAQSTDTEDLIEAMEGMEFMTPKGTMRFREEDHQALQPMYHFKIRVDDNVDWAIPELVRVLDIEDMDIPIRNQR